MSYFSNAAISGPFPLPVDLPGARFDAFERLRVSDPTGIFAASFQYSKLPLMFQEVTVGTGAATHLPNESSVSMATGGTLANAEVLIQSKQYHRYQPGKSQLVLMTFVMDQQTANVLQEVGYGDANDGLFFQDTGSQYQVVRRTSTSGSPVDNAIARSSWDDPMDGSGASGLNLDFTKAQIFWLDLEWLGVGAVRFGFVVNKLLYVAYQSNHANILNLVYMKTANLPVRWRIKNTGAAAGSRTLKAICCSVSSEGGTNSELGYTFGRASVTAVSVAAGAETVLYIIRPRLTFNSIVNRIYNVLDTVDLLSSADARWAVYYNPTITGGAWTNHDTTNSGMEYQSTLGTIANGVLIASGFVGSSGGRNTIARDVGARYPIVVDVAGAASTAIALVGQSISGTINMRGGMNWKEIR